MSSSSQADLFTPLKLGDITIPNRIGMSALTRNRAVDDAVPNDVMREYYVQRAATGLIVSEGILVTQQGTEWAHAPGIWNDDQVAGWKNITDAVHEAGGHIYAQLWHVGRLSHPDAPEQKLAGTPVYAPSAIAARGDKKYRFIPGVPGFVTPTAVEDPSTIVEQFRQAAVNAKTAGFDGVELHGANGYIIQQFLDTGSNKRTDKWGGSVENRARFGLEILKALVEVFGPNVALKVNPGGGYNDVGMPLPETLETYGYFISEADKLGLAYITLVRYVKHYDIVIDGAQRGTPHDIVESYRHLIHNAKVFINANVTPDEAKSYVSSGTADGVFFGFLHITHPDVVRRVKEDIPLTNAPDFIHLQWGKDNSALGVGYTDYPAAPL